MISEKFILDLEVVLPSGINKSRLTSCFTPIPKQFVHAPKGELNENNLGSNFGIEKPQYGHE